MTVSSVLLANIRRFEMHSPQIFWVVMGSEIIWSIEYPIIAVINGVL
jgi:hypothetical protein